MKFRQKVFFPTLLLFLLLLNGSIFAVSTVTYRNNLRMEQERVSSEAYTLSLALSRYFGDLERNGSLNDTGLTRLMGSYAAYYADDGVLLRLYRGEAPVFREDGLPLEIPVAPETAVLISDADENAYACAWRGIPDYPDYRLVYFRSVQDLEDTWNRLQLIFLLVSVGASVLLAGLLLALLGALTKPISRLTQATEQVASGDYSVQVPGKGRDELAQLTANFNGMTGEIRRRVRELEEETARKQRFLDNFTHELRTPLTNINGYSELLMRMQVSEEDRLRYLDYTMRESRRLSVMSDRLFLMTVLQHDELEPETVRWEPLLDAVAQTLQDRAAKRQVTLRLRLEISVSRGSSALLESLCVNLCENALRACAPGGQVELTVSALDGGTVIRVRDNGRGMTPEQLARVTEPFYRADKARSRAEGDVGIGLSLCSEIVRLHKGAMEFDSAPGRGTEVTVRLPEL